MGGEKKAAVFLEGWQSLTSFFVHSVLMTAEFQLLVLVVANSVVGYAVKTTERNRFVLFAHTERWESER